METKITKAMAEALSKFQASCPEINLDGKVKFEGREFKYATLGNILKLTKKPLQEAGLLVSQPILGSKIVTILTCLADSSTLVAEMPLPDRMKLQQTGADITYCRRYMYVSLLGIIGEEDKDADGMDDKVKKPVMNKKMFDSALARIGDGEPDVVKRALEALTIPEPFLKQLKDAEAALSA